jgi:hypothetical protein
MDVAGEKVDHSSRKGVEAAGDGRFDIYGRFQLKKAT